jgi:uncharacterized NAD(P)/FAD-binding protein YdhS
MTTHAIAVIGAGASGTLLALHLLRRAPPGTRVTLIDRNAPFGPGLAYATGNANHLLNVPAGRMSAFVDQPRHFVDWLERQSAQLLGGVQPTEASFVPRRLYGAYLRHLLNRELQNTALDLVHDRVTAIDGTVLQLASGRTIASDLVVLATGNDRPAFPCDASAVGTSPCWRSDPWAPDAFSALDTEASVLLIGTGLTMVDAVITLVDQGHAGPIHAVSRRGLLPRSHASGATAPPLQRKLPGGLRELTRLVRGQITASGDGWRGMIDALRPFTQEIWQALPADDRRRFLRHLRPWWDVHRHRMPPSVAVRIDAARASGQLRVYAGRMTDFATSERGTDVQLRLRDGRAKTLLVARAVNCSGPCTDVTRSDDPLLRALLRDGQARPDDCRLGLDATTAGALRGRDGTVSQTLFALGPLTRGALWEITAIPEIRRQCEVLALHLSDLLREQAQQRHMILAYA